MSQTQIGWWRQAAAVAAANGAPALVTSGIELDPHRRASFQVVKTGAAGPYQLLIWVQRNGIWAPDITPPFGAPIVGLTTSIQGDIPTAYPVRGYLEIVALTAGDTFDLWLGVEVNKHG